MVDELAAELVAAPLDLDVVAALVAAPLDLDVLAALVVMAPLAEPQTSTVLLEHRVPLRW